MIPPNNTTMGIDHPLVTVRNHIQTLERYRQLGFVLSPVSYHPWGTATSLVMFKDNFIELIAVVDPSKFGNNTTNGFCLGKYLGAFLERAEGISLVALHSKDARADHAAVTARGVRSQGLVDFRRSMKKPDGSCDEAVVSLALLIEETPSEASHFLCHQQRPELIWVPAWQNHPNGASNISSVTYLADPPALLDERFRRLYGGDHIEHHEGGFTVNTGSGTFCILDSATIQQRYGKIGQVRRSTTHPQGVAITLNVPELNTIENTWNASGVPYVRDGERLLVDAAFGGNVILEFVVARGIC